MTCEPGFDRPVVVMALELVWSADPAMVPDLGLCDSGAHSPADGWVPAPKWGRAPCIARYRVRTSGAPDVCDNDSTRATGCLLSWSWCAFDRGPALRWVY